jgi:hypothetical protein
MGTWGLQSFENDEAMDWVWELNDSEEFAAIEDAFEAVTDEAEDYLEAMPCSIAVAAAEVVAALHGRPSPHLPPGVSSWIKGKPSPGAALLAQAKQAVTTVAAESELQELWAESGHLDEWLAIVRDLEERLT